VERSRKKSGETSSDGEKIGQPRGKKIMCKKHQLWEKIIGQVKKGEISGKRKNIVRKNYKYLHQQINAV
jgi:hypothetical protein